MKERAEKSGTISATQLTIGGTSSVSCHQKFLSATVRVSSTTSNSTDTNKSSARSKFVKPQVNLQPQVNQSNRTRASILLITRISQVIQRPENLSKLQRDSGESESINLQLI